MAGRERDCCLQVTESLNWRLTLPCMTVEGRVRIGAGGGRYPREMRNNFPKVKETERAEAAAHRGGEFPVPARVSTEGVSVSPVVTAQTEVTSGGPRL